MESQILDDLRRAIKEYDLKGAADLAQKAMDSGIDPIDALAALTEAIRDVGQAFGRSELFLPELAGAADAMQAAMPIIEAGINKRGTTRESSGKVIMGSVFGDVHNIGKTMVCTLLTADGFEVIDLGIDVECDTFIQAVKEHKPNVLGMSALLTTTAAEQKKVIDTLKEEGLRDQVKIIVGGGAISEEFAEKIGADGYDPTAPGAVALANRLLGI
jgi:corrinoid protein of di/trimethylamine methyltransferase